MKARTSFTPSQAPKKLVVLVKNAFGGGSTVLRSVARSERRMSASSSTLAASGLSPRKTWYARCGKYGTSAVVGLNVGEFVGRYGTAAPTTAVILSGR